MNKRGPKIEPCGTPDVICISLNIVCLDCLFSCQLCIIWSVQWQSYYSGTLQVCLLKCHDLLCQRLFWDEEEPVQPVAHHSCLMPIVTPSWLEQSYRSGSSWIQTASVHALDVICCMRWETFKNVYVQASVRTEIWRTAMWSILMIHGLDMNTHGI